MTGLTQGASYCAPIHNVAASDRNDVESLTTVDSVCWSMQVMPIGVSSVLYSKLCIRQFACVFGCSGISTALNLERFCGNKGFPKMKKGFPT